MSEEREKMAFVAELCSLDLSLGDRAGRKRELISAPPGVQSVVWLQRMMLSLLAATHLALPFLLNRSPEFELLQETVFATQLSLWILFLMLGGVPWKGQPLVIAGGVLAGLGWFIAFPPPYFIYALQVLIAPQLILLGTTLALRLIGFQGSWQNRGEPARPWQVSIRQLLMVTTAVALSLTIASWLRRNSFAGGVSDSVLTYSLLLVIDGLTATILSLSAIGTFGASGRSGLRLLLLCTLMLYLTALHVYAFEMETVWHIYAISASIWLFVMGGSLYALRVCGWRVVYDRPAWVNLRRRLVAKG